MRRSLDDNQVVLGDLNSDCGLAYRPRQQDHLAMAPLDRGSISRSKLALVSAALLLLNYSSMLGIVRGASIDTLSSAGYKDSDDVIPRGAYKGLLTPSNLRGFLLPNNINSNNYYSSEAAAIRNLLDSRSSPGGSKRASGGLDALSGVTFGKRSPRLTSPLMEYLNLEPIISRQYGYRALPRIYDTRWAPVDAYDLPQVVPPM